MVLALRDWTHYQLVRLQRAVSNSYSFVPVHKLFGKLVRFGMVEEVLNELGEDGLECLEGGGLGHDDLNIR